MSEVELNLIGQQNSDGYMADLPEYVADTPYVSSTVIEAGNRVWEACYNKYGFGPSIGAYADFSKYLGINPVEFIFKMNSVLITNSEKEDIVASVICAALLVTNNTATIDDSLDFYPLVDKALKDIDNATMEEILQDCPSLIEFEKQFKEAKKGLEKHNEKYERSAPSFTWTEKECPAEARRIQELLKLVTEPTHREPKAMKVKVIDEVAITKKRVVNRKKNRMASKARRK